MLFVVRPTIETHYKDITSHFQKGDNNRHQSEQIRINPNVSEQIRINPNVSEQIRKSRFKALQALFLADIAHYNYKGSCGLSNPLSKVVLEAWGKCVLGYTLLPNCCAENDLHPCIIFQVGKPNTPKSSF